MDVEPLDPWAAEERHSREGGAVLNGPWHRYRLWRGWGDGSAGSAVFVMLNPSTADALVDDPTIRKCIGFAKRWGLHGIRVVNLFAYRSANPRTLLAYSWRIIVGAADGDAHLRWVLGQPSGQRVVCAWGSTGGAQVAKLVARRSAEVLALMREIDIQPSCLGRARDGNPRHPLMLSYDTPLQTFGDAT